MSGDTRTRLAKAGGVGAVAAFAVLCGLPMLVAALAGAAVAAPLAGLESPTTLALAALGFGFLAWRWQGRRRAR